MPWTTSLEIARTAIFSKFSNATGSRWHFLTTILCPFDGYLFVSGRKKTATAKRQLRSYESNISFHVLRAEPGAYLSPSLHLSPKIAPPLFCSDLEYSFIVAQRQMDINLRIFQENECLNLPVHLQYAMICRCAKGGRQVCSILLRNPRLLAA